MIPLRLSIEGLFSYQEEQVIDFRQLGAAGLFGIFGKVGSGKSSILEAMLLALYGVTDRLPGNRQNYDLMNLRSRKMRVDFEFEVHGQEYKFTVETQRHGKDFTQVRPQKRAAYRLQAGQWLPIDEANAEAILGLSRDNFRRTIILPQGKFQEFLLLGGTARTNMMMEIFGLEKFNFQEEVKSLFVENRSKLDENGGALSALEDLTDEDVKNTEAQLVALLEEKKACLAQKNAAEVQFRELEERRQWHASLEQARQLFTKLQADEAGWRQRRERLDKFERYRSSFALLLDRYEHLHSAVEKHAREMEGLQTREREAKERMTMRAEAHTKMAMSPGEITAEELTIDDLERLARIAGREAQLKTLTDRGKGLAERQRVHREEVAPFQEEKKSLETRRGALAEKLGEIAELRLWLADMDQIRGVSERLQRELRDCSEKMGQLKRAYGEIGWPGRTGDEEPGQITAVLKAGIAALERRQEDLSREVHERVTPAQLRLLREALADGKPCPVCGSLHHPDAQEQLPEGADHNRELQAMSEELKLWRTALDKAQTLHGEYSSAAGRYKALQIEKKELLDHFHEKKSRRPKAVEDIPEDPAELLAMLDTLRAGLADWDKLEADLRELERKLGQHREAGEKLEAELAEHARARAEVTAAVETLRGELKHLTGQEEWLAGADVGALARDRMAALQERRAMADKLAAEREAAEKEWLSLKASREALEQNGRELRRDMEAAKAQLDKVLHAEGGAALEEVRAVLASGLDPNAERQLIEEFFRKLERQQEQCREFEHRLAGKVHDEAAFAAAQAELETRRQAYEALLLREGELSRQHKNQLATVARRKELEAVKKQLEHRKDLLQEMDRVFKGKGFVRYISRVYLENICRAANHRFMELTRRQLSLRLNEDLEFVVVDQLNGGRERSVQTLSGGQTFQASLCLALALAESVQQKAGTRQNFFFLDEGFGSLDRESLQTVFDTLQSLRHENRIVGIISHVEELQKEIQHNIHVELDPERGSLIGYSWL